MSAPASRPTVAASFRVGLVYLGILALVGAWSLLVVCGIGTALDVLARRLGFHPVVYLWIAVPLTFAYLLGRDLLQGDLDRAVAKDSPP